VGCQDIKGDLTKNKVSCDKSLLERGTNSLPASGRRGHEGYHVGPDFEGCKSRKSEF